MSKCVLPMFSSKSFIISDLKFKCLIHFEFIFVYDIQKCSNFVVLHVAVQFSQHHLLKRLSLPHCIFLPPLSKIRYPLVHGLSLGYLSCSIVTYFCFYVSAFYVLMTVALQYSLKSEKVIALAPSFFFKTALGIWAFLCFRMNCELFCSSSVKNAIGNLVGNTLNLQIEFGSK